MSAQQNIGRWAITASMDAGGVSSGMRTMVNDTQRLRQEVSGGFTGMEQAVDGALGGVGASLSMFGMRLGFQSLTIAGLVNAMKQAWTGLGETLESDLDLGFLADQLDMSIEFLSTLQTVASENSVTAEQFSSAMQRFNQTMGQANLGSAEALQTFQQLGLNFEMLQGMRPEDQFMAIAEALADTENRSVRARLAMELFGRGGASGMLRFVEDLRSAMGDAQARGAFLMGGDLQNFRQLDDSIDRLTTRWNQAWRDTLRSIAPTLRKELDQIFEGITSLRGFGRFLLRNALPGQQGTEEGYSFLQSLLPESIRQRMDQTWEAAGVALQAMFTEGRLLRDDELATYQAPLTALEMMTDQLRKIGFAAREAAGGVQEHAEALHDLTSAQRDTALAARIIEQTITPMEAFNARMDDLGRLFDNGYLDAIQFARGAEQAFTALERASRSTQQARLPQLLEYGSDAAVSFLNQGRAASQDRATEAIVEARDILRRLAQRLEPLLGTQGAQVVAGILTGGAR